MHPILYKNPFFTIYSYGFFVALAMGISFVIVLRLAARFGFKKEDLLDLLFVLFVGGVIGARLFYVGQHWDSFEGRLWRIFYLQEGGLVWYGGFFLAVFSGILYARVKKLPILRLADFFSPILALAHGIGRVGCFFNGCCFGKTTNAFFGIFFPADPFSKRIPTQLLEFSFLFLLAGWLFYKLSHAHKEGSIFINYLFWYGAMRFLIEMLRGDQTDFFIGLTIPQWTSLILILAAFSLKCRTKA